MSEQEGAATEFISAIRRANWFRVAKGRTVGDMTGFLIEAEGVPYTAFAYMTVPTRLLEDVEASAEQDKEGVS